MILSLAVAVTRRISIPDDLFPSPTSASEPMPLDEDLFDAMTIVFMFNVVNRIANAFDIAPEWAMLGRVGVGRRIAQWIMSIGLQWHMSLEGLGDIGHENIAVDLIYPALELGLPVQRFSAIWPELNRDPSVRTAIYQLLWVSLTCSELSGEFLRRCVEVVMPAPGVSPTTFSDPLSEYCAVVFFRPFQFSPSNYPAKRLGLTEDQKLDVTFRIAIAAAFEKMNQYQQAVKRIVRKHKTD